MLVLINSDSFPEFTAFVLLLLTLGMIPVNLTPVLATACGRAGFPITAALPQYYAAYTGKTPFVNGLHFVNTSLTIPP